MWTRARRVPKVCLLRCRSRKGAKGIEHALVHGLGCPRRGAVRALPRRDRPSSAGRRPRSQDGSARHGIPLQRYASHGATGQARGERPRRILSGGAVLRADDEVQHVRSPAPRHRPDRGRLVSEVVNQHAPTPARHIRSTLIVSGVAMLRARGLFDAYFAHLGPAAHEAILGALVGKWLPLSVAMDHFAAIDALGMSAEAALGALRPLQLFPQRLLRDPRGPLWVPRLARVCPRGPARYQRERLRHARLVGVSRAERG